MLPIYMAVITTNVNLLPSILPASAEYIYISCLGYIVNLTTHISKLAQHGDYRENKCYHDYNEI